MLIKGFIEVTEDHLGEYKRLVNVAHITWVAGTDKKTDIFLAPMHKYITVKESYEEVKELIRRASAPDFNQGAE